MVKLRHLDPIGKKTVHTFHGSHEIDEFPQPPEGARKLFVQRMNLGLTIKEAAKRLGISRLEMLRLESGSVVCEDWQEALDLLGRNSEPPTKLFEKP